MESFLNILSNGQNYSPINFVQFVIILIIALTSSLIIAYIYAEFNDRSFLRGNGIHRSFPLLSIALCTIFTTLQFSIPLSLGLLGSLSIVRFRNPIKNPVDVGFILIVIASSLLIATSNFLFLLFLLGITFLLTRIIKSKFTANFDVINKNGCTLVAKMGKDTFLNLEQEILVNIQNNGFIVSSLTEENSSILLNAYGTTFDVKDMKSIRSFFPENTVIDFYYDKD